jgi:hypothetical protein
MSDSRVLVLKPFWQTNGAQNTDRKRLSLTEPSLLSRGPSGVKMRDIGWLRLPAQCLGDFRGRGDDDIRSGAVDDCSQFGLLRSRHFEFVQGQPNIVHECLPFFGSNLQLPV